MVVSPNTKMNTLKMSFMGRAQLRDRLRNLGALQQKWQLGAVGRNPPCLVLGQPVRHAAPAGFI